MADSTKYIGRWYNENLNVKYYSNLLATVGNSTNIHLRRSDNRISNSYSDIASKLEIISFHIYNIEKRLKLGIELLPTMLLDLENDISSNTSTRQIAGKLKNHWIEFYDYELTSHIEGALIQSKALLDSLTQLYSLAFNRKKIKNFCNLGKNILNDISNLENQHNHYKMQLTSIISEEKKIWIDTIIKYRNLVTHHGQLRDFRCPMLNLDQRTKYETDDVIEASMPNGVSVMKFSRDLLNDTHRFSQKLVGLLFDKLTNDARSKTISFEILPPRNSLCPCSSGDKFRNCHGKLL